MCRMSLESEYVQRRARKESTSNKCVDVQRLGRRSEGRDQSGDMCI